MNNLKAEIIKRGGDIGYIAPGVKMPEGTGAPKPLMKSIIKKARVLPTEKKINVRRLLPAESSPMNWRNAMSTTAIAGKNK